MLYLIVVRLTGWMALPKRSPRWSAVGRARLAVPALVLVHLRLAGFRVDG
jgi:hypothetical protein